MMHAFRAFAQTWFAKALLAVLALSFIAWGANSSFNSNLLSKAVISAGGHEVGNAEFKRVWDGALKQVSEQQGRPITAAEAVKNGLDRDILGQLTEQNSLWELVYRLGIRPSDKLVLEQIAKLPAFADPVTRVFSAKTYKDRLAENGYTTEMFEKSLRDDIAEAHFASGVSAGLASPKLYAAVLASLSLEQRGATYFSIDPRAAGQVPPPTDAQLTAFMTEHSAQLKRPELRTISLVRFSTAALAPTMSVDPAQVQKQYELTKTSRVVPEKRSFVQIPVRTPAEAQQVAAKLSAGEDPAAAARAIGAQMIPYTDAQKSAVPDPKIGEAAFSMQAGQTSGPIAGALGPAVIKITKITPGKAATFEEARPEIEGRLRDIAAQEKVFADAGKYGDAHDTGANLHDAAKAVGAHVYTLGPLTADGRDQYGRQTVGLTERMLKDAFATPQGGDTDLVDIGRGEFYALRVEKVIPSALPALSEVRGPLTQAWMQQETIKRMRERAEQLAARVKAGEPIDKVAAAVGAQVKQFADVSRVTAGQRADLGQALLGKLFQAKANDVFTAEGPGFAMSVVKVASIRPANPGFAAAVMQAGQQEMNKQVFTEMSQLVREASKARIKPKVDRKRALGVIGVQADDAGSDAAAAGEPPAKAGS
jgi:peptidyl-prolyl cis-trans isomerase D